MSILLKKTAALLTVLLSSTASVSVTATVRTQKPPVSSEAEAIRLSPGRVRFLYGYPDGRCAADEPLTRAQAVMMLYLLAFEADKKDRTPHFSDVSDQAWYADAAGYLQTKRILDIPAQGLFRPDDTITGTEFETLLIRSGLTDKIWAILPPPSVTRAEAVKLINAAIGRTQPLEEMTGTLPFYHDIKPGDTFYEDIMRASLG